MYRYCGASVGKHCVNGANSVVTHNIPDYCVTVGSPAKVVKMYDEKIKTWDKVYENIYRRTSMYDSMKTAFRRMGIKGVIRHSLQLAVGVQHYEENINTLLTFMNNYMDITEYPKAKGALRMVQLGDVLLLRIVDKVCQQNNIKYWVDAGTCLGMVRHGGFIPWDDDMDINMMRDDYERAVPILKDTLSKYGIDVNEKESEPIAHTGIGYKHHDTGLWIDLFPFEYATFDVNSTKEKRKYQEENLKYQRVWRKRRFTCDREKMFRIRERYIPEICRVEEAKSILNCPEWSPKPMIFDIDTILPPQKRFFEGIEVYSPNNPEKYLNIFYGDYMSFPKSGVMPHGDERGGLSSWANSSGTDMKRIIEELEKILNEI